MKNNHWVNFKYGNKYGNSKPEYKGMKFDSNKELERYIELEHLENIGLIQDLKRQVKLQLTPHIKGGDGHREEFQCSYYADFSYIKDGQLIYEDTKGFRTKEYIIKRKVLRHFYGIEILET